MLPSSARSPPGGDAAAEVDPVAVAHPLGVADEGAPFARPLALVEGGADPRLAAPPFELGRDDARVVEDEHVAGAKQRAGRGRSGPPAARHRPAAAARCRAGSRASARSARAEARNRTGRRARRRAYCWAWARSCGPGAAAGGAAGAGRRAARRRAAAIARRARRRRHCRRRSRPQDARRVGGRLARSIASTYCMPRPRGRTPYICRRALKRGAKHDEELAVGAVRILRARRRNAPRTCGSR
jgi:hypothetical protein